VAGIGALIWMEIVKRTIGSGHSDRLVGHRAPDAIR
jgi:hypothetical protein